MKFSIAFKIISIALSFLVLFSTLSFTIEKHYCGNNLVDIAVFSEVKKCGAMDSDQFVYVKKSCCKDTVDFFEGQDELNTTKLQDYNKIAKLTLVAYVYAYNKLFERLPKLIIPHKNYLSPKLIKDIHVLDETFLI